jgi:hypothetical protein
MYTKVMYIYNLISGEVLSNIAFLLVSLIKNVLNKQFFEIAIGDVTSLNRSVTCPVIFKKALMGQNVKFGRTMSDDRH